MFSLIGLKSLISSAFGLGFIGIVGIAIVKPTWLGIPQYNKNYVLVMQGSDVKGIATVFDSVELDKLTTFKCSLSIDKTNKEDTSCSIEKVEVDLSKRWVNLKDLGTKAKLENYSPEKKVDFFYRLKVNTDIANSIPWISHSTIELIDTSVKDGGDNPSNKTAFFDSGNTQTDPPAQTTEQDAPSAEPAVKPKVLATITPQFSADGKSIKNVGYFGYIAKAKEFTKAEVPATAPATGGTGTSGTGVTPTATIVNKNIFNTPPVTTQTATPGTTATETTLTSLKIKKHYFKCSQEKPTVTTTGSSEKAADETPSSNPQCWISNFAKQSTQTEDTDYKKHSFHFAKNYSNSIEKGHLYVIRYPYQENPTTSFTTLHMQVLDTSTRKPVTEGVGSIEFENIFPVFIYPFGTKAMAFDLKTSS